MSKDNTKRSAAKQTDAELQDKVTAELGKGKKLAEVADRLNITPGKAAFLRMCAEVKPKDRIKGKTDEELAPKIVKARNDQELSWGAIAARAGIPEGKVKKLYESASGKSASGQRLEGKGGRTASTKTAKSGGSSKNAKAGSTKGKKNKGKKSSKKASPSTAA